MQKKSDFKLPQIKKTHKQSSITLSKTISDTSYTPKMRPASSNKVQDLQKKLFTKLQAYDHGSRNKLPKKISKVGKQPSFQGGQAVEGYERMQKFMPGLYSKLIETKKSSFMSEQLISEFQSTNNDNNPLSAQTIERLESAKPTIRSEQKEIAAPKEDIAYSQQEMDKIFRQYEAAQGLPVQTTALQMKQLNQSLLLCQYNIQKIRKSMQGLIQDIGLQYLGQIERDQQMQLSSIF